MNEEIKLVCPFNSTLQCERCKLFESWHKPDGRCVLKTIAFLLGDILLESGPSPHVSPSMKGG